MPTYTITLIVPIKARPEHRETVGRRLAELAALTRAEPGNLFYIPYEATNQPATFVIHEQWRDQAALDFHMRQEYLLRFLQDSRPWLAEEITGMFCREIPVGKQ